MGILAGWLAALVWGGSAVLAETADRVAPPERVDPAKGKMPVLSPAELDDTLAIGGSDIDGRKAASRMTVPVFVNGAGPYRFVVDSGADSSVVGEKIAAQLQLPAGRRTILNSVTETALVDRVLVDQLRIGPTQVGNLELPVLRERDLGAQGMLGLDALIEQRLMLDFEKRVITVDEGRTPAPRFDDEIVVTARLRKGQLIITQATLNRQPISAIVDTGSEITIGNLALRDRLMKRVPDKFSEIEVIGVTGASMKMQFLEVREIKLGSIVLQNVPIAFADIPPFTVFGLENQPALLLGTDMMEHFRKISLDFHNRKVRFQLKRCQGIMLMTNVGLHRGRMSANAPAACS